MENKTKYPVNYDSVDMNFTSEEMEYDNNIERNVLQGKLNPRFIRWFNEDSNNPEPVDDSKISKVRYRTCQLCPQFDPNTKLCEKNNIFMPIKVQFKLSTCPLNKWEE